MRISDWSSDVCSSVLVQITSYKVQASGPTADGDLAQVAQIGVVSKLSQAERVVTAQELWHWDDEAKRWWLVSGFPDISASRCSLVRSAQIGRASWWERVCQ